jgi:hypothetical protein
VAPPTTEASSELDRALVGLGAGVREEDLSSKLGTVAHEAVEAGRDALREGIAEEVGDVQQRCRLCRERRRHGRVGVAERGDGDPGQEVEVATTLVVDEPAAAARDEAHGCGPVGRHQVRRRGRRAGGPSGRAGAAGGGPVATHREAS